MIIVLVAGAPALAGLPTYAILKLLGAAFAACRAVKGAREQTGPAPTTVY